MKMNTPAWMDIKFFQTAFRNYLKDDNIQILGFSCNMAVPSGENYTTDVFRANITFTKTKNSDKKESLSVIIKSTREGFLEAMAEDINLFHKEIDMFTYVLPKMHEIYGDQIFAANSIDAVLKPKPIIVMEDMCTLGYKVHERRKGLDLQHTLIVLKTLAAFHATSIIMCEKNLSILGDMYNSGIYANKEMMINWIKVAFEGFTEGIGRQKEFQIYYSKLKKISPNEVIKRCMRSWERKNNQFSVLNHGDIWSNNIMFSYSPNGEVSKCKLIDFQLAIYGSPVLDLHYFFSTSLANNIRKDINYLLDFYYAHLLVNLTVLGHNLKNVPSRDEFLEDYRERSFYGLIATSTVLPLVKAEGRKDASFEDLLKDDTEQGFRYHCYNNDVYISALSYILPYYDTLGAFT